MSEREIGQMTEIKRKEKKKRTAYREIERERQEQGKAERINVVKSDKIIRERERGGGIKYQSKEQKKE